jgi:GNAT superfamily N-acetyltransferase
VSGDPLTISELVAPTEQQFLALCDVLIDCVAGGASVSFMHPLSIEKAHGYWRGVALAAAAGERVLLVATDSAGIFGTVQLVLGKPENQPHRADVSKLLVHRRARRRGFGAALMLAAERAALARGKSLLVLDTAVGGGAERLYEQLGWRSVGVVPEFALWPHGGLCATHFYYRSLMSASVAGS